MARFSRLQVLNTMVGTGVNLAVRVNGGGVSCATTVFATSVSAASWFFGDAVEASEIELHPPRMSMAAANTTIFNFPIQSLLIRPNYYNMVPQHCHI